MPQWLQTFVDKFVGDFIEESRWMFIVNGLKTTLIVTVLALIFGTILGVVIAIIRCAHDQIDPKRIHGFPKFLLNFGNWLCKVYVNIIRGTPALVQLLIMYFIILVSFKSKVAVAVFTFSLNSAAYVSEIFRGGIMSVDKGQMEAGRSLGLGYVPTMTNIILPQAFKSTLPALGNEFITLLKETSICGYIGLNELTRGGDIIRGATFDALLPLFGVALIYLALVLGMAAILSKLERRLRKSDIR